MAERLLGVICSQGDLAVPVRVRDQEAFVSLEPAA